MAHPLRCHCGALTGAVEHERLANHSICYCEDCQAFARFLGREADLLDARGGCENIQALPRDVTFQEGVRHLACVRLSETGLLRWYAACCNTPIGNTPVTSKLPFVGLARACLEGSSTTVSEAFGPVRFCTFTSGARGLPKPEPFGGGDLAFWFIRNRLRARLAGGFRINPFFDMAADRPIATPKVLTPAERDELRTPAAAGAS